MIISRDESLIISASENVENIYPKIFIRYWLINPNFAIEALVLIMIKKSKYAIYTIEYINK